VCAQLPGILVEQPQHLDRTALDHVDHDVGVQQELEHQKASRSACCRSARSAMKSSDTCDMGIEKDSISPETIANNDLFTMGIGTFNEKIPL
jgi:hypothetical protein